MGNRFEVQVVALDRFTKVFRDLNNKASKTARPLVNVSRQLGALSREAHLDKVAKGMGSVSAAAVNMSRNLGLSLGPLESMLGVGTAGGIVGGLLAAGGAAIALGARFGATGFEVSRTAQRLGVSTDELQRYRGAAKLAGLDADGFTQAMGALGDTLQDAKFGRNPTALQMLNKLGLGVQTRPDGVIDTVATMRDLAGVLQRVGDPHVAAIISRAFGLEEALPLLRQGPAAIEALAKQTERLGGVIGPAALQWSTDFTNSLNRMQAAISGVANDLGAKLVPGLTKAMDTVTKGIDTGGAAGGIASVLKNTPGVPLLRALGWEVGLLAGKPGTTSEQRSVSGLIGGPLQQGGHSGPWAAGGGAPLPGDRAGSWNVDPAVQAARDREAMSILQRERDTSTDAETRAALTREIAARAAAGGTGDSLAGPQKVQVEVHLKNAPPGTTATARGQDNAFVPTRVSYAMPAGDMP